MPTEQRIERGQRSEKQRPLREMLFLAEQAQESGIKVLPGRKWAVHYPKGEQARTESLKRVLQGKMKPEEAAPLLKPDAITYDAEDILRSGVERVAAQIRDRTARIANYDYQALAEFVASFHGKSADLDQIQTAYDSLASARLQRRLLDSYGYTGRQQMQLALETEAADLTTQVSQGGKPIDRALGTAKLEWLTEDAQAANPQGLDQAKSKLTDTDRNLYDRLREPFRKYAQTGDQEAYGQLTEAIRENIGRERTTQEIEQEEEQLQEELKPFEEQVGPPGTSGDPAIPPEDSDEYHTPPPMPEGLSPEQQEAHQNKPFFEIRPAGRSKKPLTGYYASGRKSFYDQQRKTWSKKKTVTEFSEALDEDERQTISGTVGPGVTSIPLPTHYSIDRKSLKTSSPARLLRDQNGCFYIESSGQCTFSVDFAKEDPPAISSPRSEDTDPLTRGLFSSRAEGIINGLSGSNLEKAMKILGHVRSTHFYPGDGDLKMAQALQYKLRTESTGDNYIQNLEQSEYLECYSANTLFIAMLRKAGIPARLVIGHHVQGAKNGVAAIDASNGHAWTEVWDGNDWRRLDATPDPKNPKKDEGEKGEPGENAEDQGVEAPESQQQDSGQPQEETASDSEASEGQRQLENAKQDLERMEQKRDQMKQKIEEAKSFQELEKEREQIDNQELLDDMKQELEDKIDAKEESMKQELKDKLQQMAEDGFLDEEKREQLEKQLEEMNAQQLDQIQRQVEYENSLYNEYESIKREVQPLVEAWFRYFAERLPHEEDLVIDEDARTRQGMFDRRAVMRPRNIMFGTIRNPRMIKPDIKPKFLAEIVVDVSGSMQGQKLLNARKLLVFLNELFDRISEEFGYIRSSNIVFSDRVTEVKGFDQKYNSPRRYQYPDGRQSTVKLRLMECLKVQGGTNMLDAVHHAADQLNAEVRDYPDYASSFYFMGDGEDTCGNSGNVAQFVAEKDQRRGLGQHIVSAIFLGSESQRQTLAKIFGDENTTVAPEFNTLIDQFMRKFDFDITNYLRNKIR